MESDRSCRVGYALQPEKVVSVVQPSLIALAQLRGIQLIQVDLYKPLVEQGPFHCLVHKLYTPHWNRQLLDFQAKYPEAIVIDSPSAIQRLHNRVSMLEVIDNVSLPPSDTQIPFGIPKQVVVNDLDSLFSDTTLSLNFPVIAKPLLANGNDRSHEMCLVFNSCALNKVEPPVVLQEFVNHGGVLFKVYVAGDHVKCVKRSSLPDVSEQQLKLAAADGAEGIMPFSQISELDAPTQQQQASEPPSEFIHSMAKGLREATKLHLFNFDMIRDAKSSNTRYLIIDINYFPGYAKVSGFETTLTEFFRDVITHNQKNSMADWGAAKAETVAEVAELGCGSPTTYQDEARSVSTSLV